MSKTRIGFVGCGYMGQNAHIANYATLPDVELAALADLRPDTPREVARRFAIPRVFRTHQELLEQADVDAVVAVMGFGLHAAVVPDILAAGKHVLTEKPICNRPDTAWEMVRLAEQKGVVHHVGYMKRCDPASLRARDEIAAWRASGQWGALEYLRVSMPPGDWVFGMEWPINLGDTPDAPGPEQEPCPAWMPPDVAQKYVGFTNYYIHQVNLIRFLLGEDYSVEHVDAREKVLVATTASGVTIVLEMAPYTLRDEWVEEYTACFGRGRIALSLPAPMARQRSGTLELYRHGDSGATRECPVFPPVWSMREQARIFVEEVQGKRPCLSPATDAAKDLELAEAYIRLVTGVRA